MPQRAAISRPLQSISTKVEKMSNFTIKALKKVKNAIFRKSTEAIGYVMQKTFEKMAANYGGCIYRTNQLQSFLQTIQDNEVKRVVREHYYYDHFTNFEPYFRERLNKTIINYTIHRIKTERFPEKQIYVMTDCSDIDPTWLLLDEKMIENLEHSKDFIVFLAYNNDSRACEIIDKLQKNNIKYIGGNQFLPMASYYHLDQIAYETLMDEYSNDRKPHFCPVDFENIFQAINMTKDLEGAYVEIGTFQGASARAALNYMKRAGIKRESFFFDTFEGFTYTEAHDSLDAIWQNTHVDTSIQAVKKYLSSYKDVNVLRSNIITDSLPTNITKIAICNIDVDMYDAIASALDKVKDLVVSGGVIVAEDYGHTPCLIGAQKAVRNFLEKNPGQFHSVYLQSGQLLLIKR